MWKGSSGLHRRVLGVLLPAWLGWKFAQWDQESKVLRLTLKGIRVRISPRSEIPRGLGQLQGRAWGFSWGGIESPLIQVQSSIPHCRSVPLGAQWASKVRLWLLCYIPPHPSPTSYQPDISSSAAPTENLTPADRQPLCLGWKPLSSSLACSPWEPASPSQNSLFCLPHPFRIIILRKPHCFL